MFRKPFSRRLHAKAAALILPPARATPAVIFCIVVYAALMVPILAAAKLPEDLFMDSAEAYAWGQQLLGGYGRHPPMTGWIAFIWYHIFPAVDLSSYTLSEVMVGISLVSIYFIACRSLDLRRAVFVVFIMMLYPLFHLRSAVFSNWQVLLALLPLLVLVFLKTFETRSAGWGALLGLVAAAATLTYYSALIGLLAIGLAALLHRHRRAFWTSTAPYWAAAVYLISLTPHLLWLVERDYPSVRWAGDQVGRDNTLGSVLQYLSEQSVWYWMPCTAALLALWPIRWRAAAKARPMASDAFLVTVICIVLVAVPVLLAVPLHILLKGNWGNPFFFLIPIAVLVAVPRLQLTRWSVASSALIAGGWLLVLLVAAPIFPWLNFPMHPNSGAYAPTSEMAREVTQLWRERYNSPLPLVVSYFDLAAAVVFYSPDHPRMYADFDPAFSPWIDYPAQLHREGFVGVCSDDDHRCQTELDKIAPNAERVALAVPRKFGGMVGKSMNVLVWIEPPGS